jgi:hypothetical protein
MKSTAKKTLIVLSGVPPGYPAMAAPTPGNVKSAHKIIQPSIRSPICFDFSWGTWSTNLRCAFSTQFPESENP